MNFKSNSKTEEEVECVLHFEWQREQSLMSHDIHWSEFSAFQVLLHFSTNCAAKHHRHKGSQAFYSRRVRLRRLQHSHFHCYSQYIFKRCFDDAVYFKQYSKSQLLVCRTRHVYLNGLLKTANTCRQTNDRWRCCGGRMERSNDTNLGCVFASRREGRSPDGDYRGARWTLAKPSHFVRCNSSQCRQSGVGARSTWKNTGCPCLTGVTSRQRPRPP